MQRMTLGHTRGPPPGLQSSKTRILFNSGVEAVTICFDGPSHAVSYQKILKHCVGI